MIQYYPNYAWDDKGLFTNNKAYSLPRETYELMGIKSSPVAWWISWRHYPHMKDEALSNDANKFLSFPVGEHVGKFAADLDSLARQCHHGKGGIADADRSLLDWISIEFATAKLPPALREASNLDSDSFVAAVRAALPKRQGLTPTQLRQLRDAFAETAEPARQARVELLSHERSLAAMVERAYGLTDEEVALMWRTAPPRMPLPPPQGLPTLDNDG
jgi:hypothetical protein